MSYMSYNLSSSFFFRVKIIINLGENHYTQEFEVGRFALASFALKNDLAPKIFTYLESSIYKPNFDI